MSEFTQTSFNGGINLLAKDTGLSDNQYRIGYNVRTRFDVCSPVFSSVEDLYAPGGNKQAVVTFGNYIILFVAGEAYFRLKSNNGWNPIEGFSMDANAPRYWTVVIPLATTNYGRLAGRNVTGTTTVADVTTNNYGSVNANLPITQLNLNLTAATFGNIPGLLVQDGKNQPQFIYLDPNGNVQCRTTQTYAEWSFPLDPITLQLTGPDKREYVPVGTFMEWFDGILYIVDVNYNFINRSVSGRSLDFVVNVDEFGQKGGDATTTNFSVGVSGITAMRQMPNNSLFIAAGGLARFYVTLDKSNVANKVFGEWTFVITPLLNASCITDRGIIDIVNDTLSISSNGLRSFGAIDEQKNEGRNSIFSLSIQSLFTDIFQSARVNTNSPNGWCSAITFDDYAIFSVKTIYGYSLVVYDTINKCYVSIDSTQVGDHAVKQFAAITIGELSLYAITDDDKLYQLFGAETYETATVRTMSFEDKAPRNELKPINVRAIFENITQDLSITCSLFVNNKFSGTQTQSFNYVASLAYAGIQVGNDVGTQTNNILFSFPNSIQGWKTFAVISWTGGASLTCVGIDTLTQTPMQPTQTQAVIKQS